VSTDNEVTVLGFAAEDSHKSNLELNVAGDFDLEELDTLVLRNLGEYSSQVVGYA
jgi:hypothetical protein